MRKRSQQQPVEICDLGRLCYYCDKPNKILVKSGKKFEIVDEYCLICDRLEIEKFVRRNINLGLKFKITLSDEEKKNRFLGIMEEATRKKSDESETTSGEIYSEGEENSQVS